MTRSLFILFTLALTLCVSAVASTPGDACTIDGRNGFVMPNGECEAGMERRL